MLTSLEGEARDEPVVRASVRSRVLVADEKQVLALLEWARVSAGLSVMELAKILGVKYQTVAQYREKRRRPGMAFTVKWLKACGVELEAVQR